MSGPSFQLRRMVKRWGRRFRGGTPMRTAHGVIVSSLIGQSVVTMDGGTTNVTAFNCTHTQSLTEGTVVLLHCVGNRVYVIGAFPAP